MMLLLSLITLICQIGVLPDITYAQIQHETNIIEHQQPQEEQEEKEKAFIPNKKITMILEDTEIEIAPGEKVKTWAFNGTAPGPTIRAKEGENISIVFLNKGVYPHTMHFHGIHDDKSDGVFPVIMPGKSYTYNITAEPAGVLMYHCHVPPVSEHIRMGMYGAFVIDPKDKPLKPAKEYYMVMSEFSTDEKNVTKFLVIHLYLPLKDYSCTDMNNRLLDNNLLKF